MWLQLASMWPSPYPPAPADSADNCDVYGKTGGSVTLKLEHELTKSLTLKWTHGNEVIFERSPDGLNTGKEDNIHKNGSLRLRNVTKREGGKYKPEIFEDGQSRGNLKAISLCVLGRWPLTASSSSAVTRQKLTKSLAPSCADPVSKPRANHTCQGKVVIFNCFVSKVRSSFLEDAVLVILLYFKSEKEEEPEYVDT